MDTITLKVIDTLTRFERNVTIATFKFSGKDSETVLMGTIHHNDTLVINQELVDQLQQLVNERKPKPEIVPSKKLREAVKALVNTDDREVWKNLANNESIKLLDTRLFLSFWFKNEKLLIPYYCKSSSNGIDLDSTICKAIKAVAFYLTDGGTR